MSVPRARSCWRTIADPTSVLFAVTLLSAATADRTACADGIRDSATSCIRQAEEREGEEGARTQAQISHLLGPAPLVRAFAPFTTERDEPGVLVLYAERAQPSPTSETNSTVPENCGQQERQHIALLINGELINDIGVPDVPTKTECTWKDPPEFDSSGHGTEQQPARLDLMDLKGDGHRWGFWLRHCGVGPGRWYLLLAGYSARQRKAVIYPVVHANEQYEWHLGHAYFLDEDKPGPVTLFADSVCGEHGATTTFDRKFSFDPEREAWVMTSETVTPCEPEDPEEARTRKHLKAVLGTGKTVRDFARFRTERNEPAMLVLYLTGAEERYSDCYNEDDPAFGPFMGCDYEGVTWLEGTYFAALIIDDKIINSVPLSPEERALQQYRRRSRGRRSESPDSVQGPEIRQLPLTGYHGLNHSMWGQGKDCTTDDPCFGQIERTKLIHLADYNCDGHAWEFRLVWYEASGIEGTTLVGYSARRRQVIVYPIIADGERRGSYENFFPHPDHPGAQLVHDHSGPCHGSDVRGDREFIYDPAQEAWRMTWEQFVDYGEEPAWESPGPYGAECAVASGSAPAKPKEPTHTPPSQAAQAAPQNVFKDPDGHTLAVVLDCTEAACGQCLMDANSGTPISSAYDVRVIGRLTDQDGKPIAGKSVQLLWPKGWKIRTRTSDTGDFQLIIGSNLERKDDKPIVLNLGVRTIGSATPQYVLYMLPENYKPCG